MAEQATNPTRESGPRTDWDIGKSLNAFFPGAEVADEQDVEAAVVPDEGTTTDDDEVEDIEASGGEEAEPEEEGTSSFKLPLKVSGKEIVIESQEEAIELAQKGMHYTQEMQKLRDEQAQWASQRDSLTNEVRQQVGQYQTALKALHDTYGFVLGKEQPDWSSAEMQKLKAEKPTEYVQMREQWDQLGAIRSELSRIENEQQGEAKKQWQSWVTREQAALAEKRPEWTDRTRREQDFQQITSYAESIGITVDELGQMFDHRQWLLLHDAARYRQAEATGKTKVATTTKTAKPGSGKGVNQGDRRLRAERERLRQTGDDRAAGNLLQEIMTRRGR